MQSIPAANFLYSPSGYESLKKDISDLQNRLASNEINVELFANLLQAVVDIKDDRTIWNETYDIIAQTNFTSRPTTPVQSRLSGSKQTPWSYKAGESLAASESRSQMDPALTSEIISCLRLDILDFLPTVFGDNLQLKEKADCVFEKCQKGDAPLYVHGKGWIKWPENANESLVLKWLQDVINNFLEWTKNSFAASSGTRKIYKGPNISLNGSVGRRKLDIGIMSPSNEKAEGDALDAWSDILVIGELKSNPAEANRTSTVVDLATYAREVFRAQARRYILGFSLCGFIMTLWQFDRSGISGALPFDINKNGSQFVYVMLGFLRMDNLQLGFDITIQHNLSIAKQSVEVQFVEITLNGKLERLFLAKKFRNTPMLTGRATTCWEAYQENDPSKEAFIVKDSWQFVERSEEGELFKEATDKKVHHVARYYHHETVQIGGKDDTIFDNVRKGQMAVCSRTSYKQKRFFKPLTPEISTNGSQNSSRKRSFQDVEAASAPTFKKTLSAIPNYYEKNSPTHDRVHRRVITRDAGIKLRDAKSLKVFLTGLAGAIKGM